MADEKTKTRNEVVALLADVVIQRDRLLAAAVALTEALDKQKSESPRTRFRKVALKTICRRIQAEGKS